MILRDYIKLHAGERIKVGAKDGTNFIYADDITETTEGWFESADDKYHKRYEDLKKKLGETITELKKLVLEYETKISDLREDASDETKSDLKAKLSSTVSRLSFTESRLDIVNTSMPEWVRLLDREVIEVYGTPDFIEPIPTNVVLIRGTETGAYWLCSEFRKGCINNERNGKVDN